MWQHGAKTEMGLRSPLVGGCGSQVRLGRAVGAFRCFSSSDNGVVRRHRVLHMACACRGLGTGDTPSAAGERERWWGFLPGLSQVSYPPASQAAAWGEEEEEMKFWVFTQKFRVFSVLWSLLSQGKSLILCLHLHLALT